MRQQKRGDVPASAAKYRAVYCVVYLVRLLMIKP
jgi:hypothetical protein